MQVHELVERLVGQDIAVGAHDGVLGDAGVLKATAERAPTAQRALFSHQLDGEAVHARRREVLLDDVATVAREQDGSGDAVRMEPAKVMLDDRHTVEEHHGLGTVVRQRTQPLTLAAGKDEGGPDAGCGRHRPSVAVRWTCVKRSGPSLPGPQHSLYTREAMPSLASYDVAVIGAGPAGSRTAAALASLGHRVALLERHAEPGQPVHCTGIVSDECFQRYELPASLVIRSVSSFVLRSPSGRGAPVRRKTVQAHVLDRAALDRSLAARAVEAGADLLTSTAVEDVRWTGTGVELAATVRGEPARIGARVAVVATGFGAPIARKLGMGQTDEVLSGCQAVVDAYDVDAVEVFTGDALGEGGYGWLVPWKPGLALAGLLTRRHTMTYLRDHVARLQEAGRIGPVQEMFRCRPIPLSLPRRTVWDGVLGVGDVVSQVKPTSGGGIYYALLGADAAARTIAEALEADDVTASGLAPYEQRWRAAMESEIRQGVLLRKLLEQLPEAAIEHLHRLLGVPGLRRVLVAAAPSLDWHSSKLTRVLQHFDRRRGAVQAPAS